MVTEEAEVTETAVQPISFLIIHSLLLKDFSFKLKVFIDAVINMIV